MLNVNDVFEMGKHGLSDEQKPGAISARASHHHFQDAV